MGSVPDFGVDIEQDLLRAVTGIPSDRMLADRMTGRDNLTVSVEVALGGLPALLDRYLEKFGETTYQKDFAWVDKVRELTDRTKIAQLDEALIEQFRKGSFEKVWMAVPDVVEWERIEGFRYGEGTRSQLATDLHVSDLRTTFRSPASMKLDSLQKQVRAYPDGGQLCTYHWPAYKCLYCEAEDGTDTYLLTNGKWFRIATDFVEAVTEEVRSIPEQTTFPEYNHRSEADYNRALVATDPARLALMDAKNIVYGGGYSKIEFCDCFSNDGEIIHVKRYGGSAVLSHLFQQGVVSGNLWVVSPEFRAAVNEKLPSSHKLSDPNRPLDRGAYRVLFGITTNRDRPLYQALPFFSRLTLRNAAMQLRGFGYEVGLQRIFDASGTARSAEADV